MRKRILAIAAAAALSTAAMTTGAMPAGSLPVAGQVDLLLVDIWRAATSMAVISPGMGGVVGPVTAAAAGAITAGMAGGDPVLPVRPSVWAASMRLAAIPTPDPDTVIRITTTAIVDRMVVTAVTTGS